MSNGRAHNKGGMIGYSRGIWPRATARPTQGRCHR